MYTIPVIKSISIRNLLSFGPKDAPLELKPLNVLIGPNGSGKSNLVEVFGLLQSTGTDLAEPIRAGGGITEWLWKGGGGRKTPPIAAIDVLVAPLKGEVDILYHLSFTRSNFTLEIVDERIENKTPFGTQKTPYLYYGNVNGRTIINVKGQKRELKREDINPKQSVLSQRKDPDQYPEVTYLGNLFGRFAFYRDWEFGINSEARQIHGPDQPSDHLEEDFTNLALMISRIKADPEMKLELLQGLRDFYSEAIDINAVIRESLVELLLEERSQFTTPAVRMSDGTLRWLALLCILFNPTPPPLVCIEEPELGLHPDVIPVLANMLVRASERMQLIVTTHSEILVEALSEMPDAVIVCEKHDGTTVLRRLERALLSKWLEDYSLGQLWRKGELGGTRW